MIIVVSLRLLLDKFEIFYDFYSFDELLDIDFLLISSYLMLKY